MINFLSKEDAEASFWHAQAPYGGTVFVTKVATINYFNEVRQWSAGSPTARAIVKYVEESDVVINFIGMNGGFQCFDESADNRRSAHAEPTIYVDLRGRLHVYVRGPHENLLRRDKTPGLAANPNAMQPFNNKLALLHELGHAKQFIERPQWYRFYADARRRASFRDALEQKATQLWTRKLTAQNAAAAQGAATQPGAAVGGVPVPPGPPGAPPRLGIPAPPGPPSPPGPPPRVGAVRAPGPPPPPGPPGAPPAPGAPRQMNMRQQLQAIVPATTDRAADQSWFVVLDVDNMQRHEWPMCEEMRLPKRLHYSDLSV